MGWLFVGFCTFIAGYVLYNFYTRGPPDRSVRPPLKSHRETPSVPANQLAPTRPVPPVVLKLPGTETNELRQGDSLMPEISVEQVKEKTPRVPPTMVVRSASPPRLKPPSFDGMPAPPRPGSGLMRPRLQLRHRFEYHLRKHCQTRRWRRLRPSCRLGNKSHEKLF